MNFGLLYELGVPKPWGPRSEYDAYWNAIAQVQEAERVGFTHVWAVEHHFLTEFSHSSAPEVWLAAVAQHTETIRIGHGVVQVPAGFNNPVRVAERAAALDILSNGRLEFGGGRSITSEELEGFNIAIEDSRPMWREAMELIPKIWTSEGPIHFDGQYTQIPDREIVPKPLQKPHPPLWAAGTNPASFRLAGEIGVGMLAFGTGLGPEIVGRRIAEYREGLANATPVGEVNENVAMFMMTLCAETDEEAKEIAEGPFATYLDSTMEHFLQWGRGGNLPPGYEWYAEASQKSEKLAERMKFDHLFENGMVLVGTPERITETIRRYRDVGVTQILCGTQFAGITQDQALNSIRLFGEAVIPHFAEAEVVTATR
jgi:alkanesulfonate monooxygenase SsuD/methylene tetrahydromethanopterin reductase-like flavin-dependent oxidoreductase (luciferase family)